MCNHKSSGNHYIIYILTETDFATTNLIKQLLYATPV
jgi:hypothetical protein